MSSSNSSVFPSFLVAGAPVAANTILVASATAGSLAVAGLYAGKFIGVNTEATDTNGYAFVQTIGTVQVRVGAVAVVAGDRITSDASGLALATGASASGTILKQIIGIAMNSAAAGALVDVFLQPDLVNGG